MDTLLNMLVNSYSDDGVIEQINVILASISDNIYNQSVYISNLQEMITNSMIGILVLGVVGIASLIMVTILAARINKLEKRIEEFTRK